MINEHDLEGFDYYTPEENKTPQEMVKDYHTLFGLPIGEPVTTDLAHFRGSLIKEEFEELAEAEEPEHAIKEMADLIYVLYGAAVTFGWNLEEAFRRVHENNMKRGFQDDGTVKKREDGKVLKNPNTPKVDLSDLV